MNPLEHIMGVDEASKRWDLSPAYIKNLCAAGKVTAVKIGNTWILDKDQSNPAQPDHPKNWRSRVTDQP
ncbi:hypothetical protein ACE6ED_15715 [Paenibacillus sp. CN-4]|uniref:hypothetical protein n=1 Tax=Paenibacillus nanchangensis TaxID=3348343 RepID=UPI00397B6963